MKLYLSAAVYSHIGRVRANNEDNFYLMGHYRKNVSNNEALCSGLYSGQSFLTAVADGMGGEEYGEVASHIAVKCLHPCHIEHAHSQFTSDARLANDRICLEAATRGGVQSGSTLTALYIDDGKAVCCNLGDSRGYLFRKKELKMLSTDHQKAARMVQLGVLTPEQAARHPSRHELTRYLGIPQDVAIVEPSISETVTLFPGDIFLLCSDGLTDMVPDGEIAALLEEAGSAKETASKLVQCAVSHGGRDNVTVAVVQVLKDCRTVFERIFSRR